MPDIYTHNIKFEIDGSFMRGEAEFNQDGEASYKIVEWSEPIPDYVIKYFREVMDICKKIVHSQEEGVEIKKIIIKKK